MANIAKVLKDEVQRLARKEVKDSIGGLRKDYVTLKRTIADHKRRLKELERQNKKLAAEAEKQISQHTTATAVVSETEVEKARISSKIIKSIRKTLGISQKEFASLIGVSCASVTAWEQKKGRLQFRNIKTKAAIVEARGLTKDEAQERLGKKIPAKKEPAAKKAKSSKKTASKKTQSRATEAVLKIIRRFKKGASISKIKELTGFDDKKVRNVLYFSSKQGNIRGLGRGVYVIK